MNQPDGDSRPLSAADWSAEVYGFNPDNVKTAERLLLEVAMVVAGTRPDRAFVIPILTSTLKVELHDYVRGHIRDQSEGFASPKAKRDAASEATQGTHSWPAQPQERRRKEAAE